MKIGPICERKLDLIFDDSDPADMDSELMSVAEEDELVSGLRDAGHQVLTIRDANALLRRLSHWKRNCDLIVNRSTGYRGRDRTLLTPAVLEVVGIPYVGCTPYVHGLVRNKLHTKLVVASAGLLTPSAVLVREGEHPDLARVTFPAIVKPVGESSSLGIETGRAVVADAASALERARLLIARYNQPAIVETFIRGTEIEVPLLTDPAPRALGAVALTLDGNVVAGDVHLVSDVVYGDGYGFADPPAEIDLERVCRAAETAARELGIRDYGRVDFRVAEDGSPWLMEANSLPHLQRHSSFYHLARGRGLAYHAMLDELLTAALRRIERERGGQRS